MERNIATMELTRYAAVAINTDVARAMRRRGTVELQVLVAPGRILTLHDVTVTGNTSGAEGGGGGGIGNAGSLARDQARQSHSAAPELDGLDEVVL